MILRKKGAAKKTSSCTRLFVSAAVFSTTVGTGYNKKNVNVEYDKYFTIFKYRKCEKIAISLISLRNSYITAMSISNLKQDQVELRSDLS